MIVVFIFIFGLFVGSFLNVVIYRLHRQETFVKGFSKCLFCGHRLYSKDLVPLFSYLFLKGKCRYCKQRFSHQYPLVELFTAVSFSLIFIKIFPQLAFYNFAILDIVTLIFWWAMTAFLIIIFVYDLKYYLVLDIVVLPAVVIAFIVNLFLGFSFLNLLLAAVVGGGFFLLQFVVSKGRWIGGGDIRVGLLMGALLGWPQLLTALFAAYMLGAVISVGLLAADKKNWSDKVPFGTFLSVATFLVLLYGNQLVHWYWSLF
ncbi:prepilin peptidase [Candidatus Parcubacteria bacterium]|jgi:prepilin signal peptidase PulO-like enzyme (type II secretory pathway)|nr:prepilin peptidase [Candidatus Parcubacteria bacterium]